MTNNVTVEVNGVKVTVDVEELVEREVKKRLKKLKPKEVVKEIVKEVKPYIVNQPGRAKGNTYRLLLEAQLIASSKGETHVIVVSHTHDYARQLFKQAMDMAYPNTSKHNHEMNVIYYPNGSTIRFRCMDRLEQYIRGLHNVHLFWDKSCSFAASYRMLS